MAQWPMLRVLLPVVGGILLAQNLSLPTLYLWSGILLLGLASWRLSLRGGVVGTLFLLGWLAVEMRQEPNELPLEEPLALHLRIEEEPRLRPHGATVTARLEGWCGESMSRWVSSKALLMVHADTSWTPRRGERLVAIQRLHLFSPTLPDYAELMFRRGYRGVVWLRDRDLIERDTASIRLGWFVRIHTAALHRLDRLTLSPEVRAVAEAMAVGERRGLTPALRTTYARSGTSHLLAVSGLHVGILFWAAGFLLGGIRLLRHGHRWLNGLLMLAVWGYALLTGGSPSVLRAAAMFSALQIAQARSLHYNALNTLFGIGAIMLVLNPDLLFDISFQLSFLAVLAILIASKQGGIRSRIPGLQWLFGTLWIGWVSAIATAPLVSLRFGLLAPIGLLANPLAILLAEGMLILSLGWILLPIPGLSPLFSSAIEGLGRCQEGWLKWVSSLPYAAFDYTLPAWAVALIYLLFFLLTLWIWSLKPKKIGIFAERKPNREV